MPGSVTARDVLERLSRHEERCEALNAQTVEAFKSMSESHRAVAKEIQDTRKDIAARWDELNANAWKALGAVGLTILAGIVGVGAQSFVQYQDAAQKAAQAAQAAAQTARTQQVVVAKLGAIQAAQAAASNATQP